MVSARNQHNIKVRFSNSYLIIATRINMKCITKICYSKIILLSIREGTFHFDLIVKSIINWEEPKRQLQWPLHLFRISKVNLQMINVSKPAQRWFSSFTLVMWPWLVMKNFHREVRTQQLWVCQTINLSRPREPSVSKTTASVDGIGSRIPLIFTYLIVQLISCI